MPQCNRISQWLSQFLWDAASVSELDFCRVHSVHHTRDVWQIQYKCVL